MMSSLYVGASGMKSQGQGLGVISTNIANVGTVGYKQLSMQYADLMSQYMTTSSGNAAAVSQKGLGAAAGTVRTLFTQGGVEKTEINTDLLINGQGFFGVSRDGKMHYTRAGNFSFSKEGELLDPSGWSVMGRPLNGETAGAPEPIRLDMGVNGVGSMDPQASSMVTVACNLGGLENTSVTEGNPFFTLASSWNGKNGSPLPKDGYGFSQGVEFYDQEGTLRSARLYFDTAGKSNGKTSVEYVLGLPPEQDGSSLAGSSAAGLLLAGTLTFGPDGSMQGMTAFTPPENGDPSDLSGWVPAPVKGGKPVFTFQGGSGDAQAISLDMGFSLGEGGAGNGLASAAEAASHPESIYTADGAPAATSFLMTGTSPAGIVSGRDGYAQGGLRDVSVGKDGIVKGVYSNGQEQDLYRISLYRFTSEDGLRHEGGNHYSATLESGPAGEGQPGTENFGSLTATALEQSNVDYAREFTLLISTQRGFQMNSKVVTTSDAMLQKALELKR